MVSPVVCEQANLMESVSLRCPLRAIAVQPHLVMKHTSVFWRGEKNVGLFAYRAGKAGCWLTITFP